MTNPHDIRNLIKRANAGESLDDIEREMMAVGKKRSKEKGKAWGICESCEQETVLVELVGLCGVCCFGESETANGNW
jgi:hypothetical protein